MGTQGRRKLMGVLKLILEMWYLILPVAVFIGGLIYRKITHQPFKGEIPPVGVLRDLPSSVTGLNKQEEKTDENTQKQKVLIRMTSRKSVLPDMY